MSRRRHPSSKQGSPLYQANYTLKNDAIKCKSLLNAVELGKPVLFLEEMSTELISIARKCLKNGADLNKQRESQLDRTEHKNEEDDLFVMASAHVTIAVFCLFRVCHLSLWYEEEVKAGNHSKKMINIGENSKLNSVVKLCYHACMQASIMSEKDREMCVLGIAMNEAVAHLIRQANTWFSKLFKFIPETKMPVPPCRKSKETGMCLFRLDEKSLHSAIDKLDSIEKENIYSFIRLIIALNSLSLQLYANLAILTIFGDEGNIVEFLQWFQDESFESHMKNVTLNLQPNKNNHFTGVFNFLTKVINPWIGLLLSLKGNSDEVNGVCSNYSMKSHHILCAAAQTLEQTTSTTGSKHLENDNQLQNTALSLRIYAIYGLLLVKHPRIHISEKHSVAISPSDFVASTSVMTNLFQRNLESACSYAWKGAAIYSKLTQAKDKVDPICSLEAYYEILFETLFICVQSSFTIDKASSQDILTAFSEFCVWYFLFLLNNTSDSICMKSTKIMSLSSMLCSKYGDDIGSTVLSLLDLTRKSQYSEPKSETPQRYIKQVQDTFVSINGSMQGNKNAIERCYRLLSIVRQTLSLPSASDFQYSLRTASHIYMISFILCDIFVPVCQRFVWGDIQINDASAALYSKICNDPKKIIANEQMIDSLVKSILTYEKLIKIYPSCHHSFTLEVLQVYYTKLENLLRVGSSIRMLDYASKALGAIGMSYIKENNYSDALFPLLVSAQAATFLPKASRTISLKRSIMLASILYKQSRKNDSLRFLFKLLKIEIYSCDTIDRNDVDQIAWASIVSYEENIWSNCNYIIAQIVTIFFGIVKPLHNDEKSFAIDPEFDKVFQNSISKVRVRENMKGVDNVVILFTDALGSDISRFSFFGVFSSVLYNIGKLISIEEEENSNRLMVELDEVIKFLREQFVKENTLMMEVSTLTILSRALGDIRSRCARKGGIVESIQAKAQYLATEALTLIRTSSVSFEISENQRLIAILALSVLVLELHGEIEKDDWIGYLLKSFEKVIYNQPCDKEKSILHYIQELSLQLYSFFRSRGLTLASVQVLSHFIQISVNDVSLQKWAQMMLLNVTSESNLLDMNLYLVNNIKIGHLPRRIDDCFIQLEKLESSSVQTFSEATINSSKLPEAIQHLQQIIVKIEQISEQDKPCSQVVNLLSKKNEVLWAKSTCLLRLADLYRQNGNLETSFKTVRSSADICRQLLASNNGSNSFNYQLHFTLQWFSRVLKCFQILSDISLKFGNRRRAEAYIQAATDMIEIQDCDSRIAFEMKSSSKILLENRRIRWELEILAGKENCVPSILQCAAIQTNLPPISVSNLYNDFQIEVVQRLLSAGDAKRNSINESLLCAEYYREAEAILTKLTNTYAAENGSLILALHLAVKLRMARVFELSDESLACQVKETYETVRLSETVYKDDKVYACYRLGRIYLSQAKTSGALSQLWQQDSSNVAKNSEVNSSLSKAIEYFRQAMSLSGFPTTPLGRKVHRCLALSLGPTKPLHPAISLPESSLLVHRSMRASHRKEVVSTTKKPHIRELFQGIDGDYIALNRFLSSVEKNLPNSWNVVAISTCPTGDLLFSSIRNTATGLKGSIRCVISSNKEKSILLSAVIPLNQILDENQRQLSSSTETDKRDWWAKRQALDNQMKDLLNVIDKRYLTSEVKRTIFHDTSFTDPDHQQIHENISHNLVTRFEEAVSIQENIEGLNQQFDAMKVSDLKDALEEAGIDKSVYRGFRKAELKELLIREKSKGRRRRRVMSSKQTPLKPSASNCFNDESLQEKVNSTLLILDENIHRIPWESLPTLESKSICRIPSLPFAISPLIESGSEPKIDVKNVSYILDPESNLPKTRSTLAPIFESVMKKHKCEWPNIIGEIPSSTFFENSLCKKNGLLIYCGHGGGQKFFSKAQIEALHNTNASIILMGCSSGRLASASTKKETTGEPFLYYEPVGLVCSYLTAGSPCVVGNLWDVTDRDIDRFFVRMTDELLGKNVPSEDSLADSVSKSRAACKMRYLVGSAPVCYGVPVHL